jgi:hypothetical protein
VIAIISLGQSLQLRVVAEGVETAEHRVLSENFTLCEAKILDEILPIQFAARRSQSQDMAAPVSPQTWAAHKICWADLVVARANGDVLTSGPWVFEGATKFVLKDST